MELLIIHLSDDVVVSLTLLVSTTDESHNDHSNDPVVPSSVGWLALSGCTRSDRVRKKRIYSDVLEWFCSLGLSVVEQTYIEKKQREEGREKQELKSNQRGIQERNQEKRSPRGRKFIIITVEACAVLPSIHIQNERSKTTTTEEEEEEQQRKQHHHGCGTSKWERERRRENR